MEKYEKSTWRMAYGVEFLRFAFGDLAMNMGAILGNLTQMQPHAQLSVPDEESLTSEESIVKISRSFLRKFHL